MVKMRAGLRDVTRMCAVVIIAGAMMHASVQAKPGVSMSGFLDADVWTDFAGNFYTNSELDLGTSLAFDSAGKVTVNLYTTVRAGTIPAGAGEPGDRWAAVVFDGLDLTWATKAGTFTVGDFAWQYGKFNYYFYKRQSMITPESFTRGLKYTYDGEKFSQSVQLGAADVADELVSYHYTVQDTAAGDTLLILTMEDIAEGNAADLGGATTIKFGESASLSLFYGVRSDMKLGFDRTGLVYGGLEFAGAFAEDKLKLKFDLGYRSIPGAQRANAVSVLFEPTLALGDFSLALSYYQCFDLDDVGASLVGEDLFVYLEPGYTFSDVIAAGLPLEIHANGPADRLTDDGAFWAVPTLYVYPFDGVQWWVWGQVVVPLAGGDLGYGLGSELIIEF